MAVDFLGDKADGVAVEIFATTGSSDTLVYPTSQTGSPNSRAQANYLPINKGTGSAFWPRSNVLSLRYVI